MTYEQYWDGKADLVKAYIKADKLKREVINRDMWWQGLYFYEAICKASPIFNPYAKQGVKPIPYSERPYATTKEEIKRRKQEEIMQSAEDMRTLFLMRNAKYKKEQEMRERLSKGLPLEADGEDDW